MTTRKNPGPSCRSTNLGSTAAVVPGLEKLRGLPDNSLLSNICALNDTERRAVLEILLHLIEIERRDLYLRKGFSSLFDFCIENYGYSRATAWRRISVARCMAKYPRVYQLLRSGQTTISNIAALSKILDPENAGRILSDISGMSKMQVLELVGRYDPKAKSPDKVRPVFVKTQPRTVGPIKGTESDKSGFTGETGKCASRTSMGDMGVRTCESPRKGGKNTGSSDAPDSMPEGPGSFWSGCTS